MNAVRPPLYRLMGPYEALQPDVDADGELVEVGGWHRYSVDLWLGEAKESEHGWGSLALTQEIAAVTSRDAGIAVLRLCGAEVFHDWTQPRAHWGMPVTLLCTDARKEKRGT